MDVSKLCLVGVDGWPYRRVNGNLRTMAKSNEMIRLEIPNRIAQASVQAFKVSMVNRARNLKEKNMVTKLDQGGVKLCWSAGYYPKAEFHMSTKVDQVLHRLG